MANFDTNLFRKGLNHRGVYGGKEQTVTGLLTLRAGAPIATTDLIRAVPLGENVRPIRITLVATPISGTPVLTNFTVDVGVAPLSANNLTRPDGTVYTPLTADVDALVDAMVVDGVNMETSISVNRPVANGVARYAPFAVTLTPSGAGALSVSGGDVELAISVTFLGEQIANGFVYDQYINQKVKN